MSYRYLSVILGLLVFGIFWSSCNGKKSEIKMKQEYATVYAKKKIYHKDGTRSYTDYLPFETRTVENLAGYEPPSRQISLNKLGGRRDRKIEATGFFYVKKLDGRWWCVDPLGNLFINIAVNSINRGKSERNQKALKKKFADSTGWIEATRELLFKYGFNGAGSWSDDEAIRNAPSQNKKPLVYTVNLGFMSGYGEVRGGTYQVPGHKGYPNNSIFVFDPDFKKFSDEQAKKVLKYKDDPNLLGYFSDNEMPFRKDNLEGYLDLPEEDPGHQAAKKWLAERGLSREQITDAHRLDFMALVVEKYLSVVRNALKKYDPNHMYLGCRFYSKEKDTEPFMRAAGKYLDIVSINYYGKWTPNHDQMNEWAEWTGRPFIITEFYTKGEDSGMPNQSGAGWIVKTQQDRGLFYQNYCLALLESRNCVGWHYFKYQDNDPTLKGAEPSNVDSNKGIVNNYYEAWTPMLEKMGELNHQVYSLIDFFDR